VPPPSSRATFVRSSVIGKRVIQAGVAVVDRLDSRCSKQSFAFQDAMFKRGGDAATLQTKGIFA
jgi:hypothetical protein